MADKPGTPDSRLPEIETLLAHHERQIADLSEMIGAQWKEIDRLGRKLSALQDRLAAAQEEAGREAGEKEGLSIAERAALDKPPHY